MQALLQELDELDVMEQDKERNSELEEEEDDESIQQEDLHHTLALGDNEPNHFVEEEKKDKTIREPSVLSVLWDGVDQVFWQLDLWHETTSKDAEDRYNDEIEQEVMSSENMDKEDARSHAKQDHVQLQEDLERFLLRSDM